MIIQIILFADATAQSGAAFGQGTGPISLTNIGCTGNESRLADCSADTNTAGCTHSNDASATCVIQCKLWSQQLSLAGWYFVGYRLSRYKLYRNFSDQWTTKFSIAKLSTSLHRATQNI